jgi:hypothetical protein
MLALLRPEASPDDLRRALQEFEWWRPVVLPRAEAGGPAASPAPSAAPGNADLFGSAPLNGALGEEEPRGSAAPRVTHASEPEALSGGAERGGIGLRLAAGTGGDAQRVEVVGVDRGGPAGRTGHVAARDRIVSVDGLSVFGLSPEQARPAPVCERDAACPISTG